MSDLFEDLMILGGAGDFWGGGQKERREENGASAGWPARMPGMARLFGAADITEKDGELTAEIDLPGVRKENISVRYAGGILSVEARSEAQEEQHGNVRLERGKAEVGRSFDIGEGYESFAASYDGGVLKITAKKKKEEPEAGKIEIR